jgi:hypothetical protein
MFVQPRLASAFALNARAKIGCGALTLPRADRHSGDRTAQEKRMGRTAMTLLRRHVDEGCSR